MEVLPVRYEATLQVDNKPFYANAKAVALLGADTPLSRNTIRIGAEWNMSKNYGGGLLYDVTRPFTDLMSSHPRRYDALPALHRLSAFLEDNTTITAGEWRIEIMAGLRTTAMANLGSRYTLQGQIPFRSACQPLGDASGVRHGRRPDAHHIRGRRGMAHQKRLRSTSSSPNRTTPITRGSTISRRTTNRNAVSMWKSSSTTPPITT